MWGRIGGKWRASDGVLPAHAYLTTTLLPPLLGHEKIAQVAVTSSEVREYTEQDLGIFDFRLADDEMARLSAVV